jgi:vacuolar-type H+-ATPase subunit E/Vma4
VGIEELIGRLERDAQARIAAVEAGAKREVDAIGAAAEKASSRAAGESLASRRAQRRSRLDREVAEARTLALADRLKAEHALLDRVMTRAETLLGEMDLDGAYLAALPARLTDALGFLGGRAARVRCRPALAAAVRSALAGRGDVTIEEVPALPAGFSVVASDGSVEVDDTLPARLSRLRRRLSIELLAEVGR